MSDPQTSARLHITPARRDLGGGFRLRVLVGEAFGATSPVAVRSPTLYLDIALSAGDALPLPLADERALYLVGGSATLEGEALPQHTLVVLEPGQGPMLAGAGSERPGGEARVVLIGGQPLGPRTVWWNFVSSRKDRIAQAADAWRAGHFDPVPGETGFIPLPDKPLPAD